MAQVNLNVSLIRDGRPKEFVLYLNELRENQLEVSICQSLFEAVDREYLLPNVFDVFLSWSQSVDTIIFCIHNQSSRHIRKAGIKHLGKALANPRRWDSAWTAIGGTEGLIGLLAKISVAEVSAIMRVIGRCNRGQHKIGPREKAIEELLHALLPSHYAGSKTQSLDKRPIEDHYAKMVPACSSKFVNELLDAKDWSNPLYRKLPATRLTKTHGILLRKRVIECLFGDACEEGHIYEYLNAFVYSQPPSPGLDPQVSASMAFAERVLQLRLENINNDKHWPSTISEASVLHSLLQRSLKRSLPETRLCDIFTLGLKLLEAKPQLKPEFRSKGIWSELIAHWKKAPKLYEDSLALALRLQLGGPRETFGHDFFITSRAVPAELRWPLLRLYYLHALKGGIDIDTVNDFEPLAKQPWPIVIFHELSKTQAIRLLKGFLNANLDYSFLQVPTHGSILSNKSVKLQRNFNAVLLLTILKRSSKETQRDAERAVDELRKKAATAKEQPDRAIFANAASAYAIASGNLDLYGETITWQQRFVRDPLTSKAIFGRNVVTMSEGIELLSGIPEPLPEDITLDEVASRVAKANEILMTFHETMRMAKREPSFHESDWTGVTSLFSTIISRRVTRAAALQKLLDPEADLYTAIWAGTLSMLGKLSIDSIRPALMQIVVLFGKLPPTALVATTKAMLDAGDEKRKRQNRQPEDDILERLSYGVLLRLAKGDKPQLAQHLVLRTILDRPDASSWHRQLLSASLMKRLPAKDAHGMLLAFATAIGEKLEEQSYIKVGEKQPPQSLVKVTTVKYLAQLLDNAEFISAEAAVEVLVELFKAGTHRDIRLATLDSLLSLLNSLCSGASENWKSSPLVKKIMGALEVLIPIVGSVNERRPPQFEDWEEARETGTLPEISDVSDGVPPLLNAMLTAPNGQRYPGLKNLQAEFVARFLLPILEHSQAEHRRWVALFLAKHKVSLTVDDIPPTPISPKVWNPLMSYYREFIPQAVLEDFNKYIVTTIAPPTVLKDFNNSLRKDTSLCNTPEVLHWLSVFDQRMDLYFSSGTLTLLRMIHHGHPRPSIRNGITFSKVQDMVILHASLLLDDYENYTYIWNVFVKNLRHPTKGSYPLEELDSISSMVSKWHTSGKLVLEKVTALVMDKKNQHMREHKRSILPSATKLRLWLLPFPCFPEAAEADNRYKAFVKELENLLDSFLKGENNVIRWPKFAEDAFTISKSLHTDEERLRVALYIGELVGLPDAAVDQKSSALNYVRVALAMRLIEKGWEGLKNTDNRTLPEQGIWLVEGLKNMIEGWQRNYDDEIRGKVRDWKNDNTLIWKTLWPTSKV